MVPFFGVVEITRSNSLRMSLISITVLSVCDDDDIYTAAFGKHDSHNVELLTCSNVVYNIPITVSFNMKAK